MKVKEQKDFDTVRFFQEVKQKVAKETKGMTFAEFKTYLNNRKLRSKSAEVSVI